MGKVWLGLHVLEAYRAQEERLKELNGRTRVLLGASASLKKAAERILVSKL